MTQRLRDFPAGLPERLAELDTARTRFLDEVERARHDFDAQPDRDLARVISNETGALEDGSRGSTRWSLAEIVYHLHLGESATTLGLKRKLASPERAQPATVDRLRADWERISKMIGVRHTRVQAPARVVPDGAPELGQCLALLAESRRAFLQVIESASEKDLLSIALPHPFAAIGELIGISWISATAFHELRHSEQVREMIAERIAADGSRKDSMPEPAALPPALRKG